MRRLPKRDINKLTRRLHQVEGVEAAILYGSIARGDYGPRSDIDILVLVEDVRAGRMAREILAEIELSRSVQPTIRTKKQLEQTDFGLLRKIFQEGLVLFAKKPLDLPAADVLQIKPYTLFVFELGRIAQKEKARFNRELYQSKRHGGTGGVIGEVGGRKLARGCVLAPAGARRRLEMLFKRFKVEAEGMQVWL